LLIQRFKTVVELPDPPQAPDDPQMSIATCWHPKAPYSASQLGEPCLLMVISNYR